MTAAETSQRVATSLPTKPPSVPPVVAQKPPPAYPFPSSGNTTATTLSSLFSSKLGLGGLLPYSVTPPKPKGPSEAEKKIEAMMAQIEEEMENGPPSGDYFGVCHTCGERVQVLVG